MNDNRFTGYTSFLALLWPALVALGVTLLFLSPIDSMDIWWHLDSGRWMVAHHRYLGEEIRSYSMPGAEWHNFAWLFQVVVALVERWGGMWGLLLLKGILWWLIFTLLFHTMGRRGAPLNWLLPLLLFSWQLFPRLYLRPHLFEGVFLAVVIWLVQREPRRRDVGWYALLIVVWANMHASVVVGAAALALHYLVGPTFAWPGFARLRRRLPIALLLLSLVFVTPNGIELLNVLTGHAQGEEMYAYIREWLPPDTLPPFVFVAIAGVTGVALLKRDFLRPAELLLMIIFLVLGAGSRRFLFELALLLLRPAAVLTGWFLSRLGERFPRMAGRNGWIVGGLMLFLILQTYQAPFPWRMRHAHGFPAATERYPHVAMAVLQPVLKGEQVLKIWNPYGWGGYIGWRGQGRVKVFIDGRTPTVFSEEMMLETNLSHRRPAMLRSLAAQWGVGAILLHSVVPLPIPPGDPTWRLVAYDAGSVLYLRRDLARRYRVPEIGFDPFRRQRQVTEAMAQQRVHSLRQLLAFDEDNALAWFHLAEYLGQLYRLSPSKAQATALLKALRHSIQQSPDQLLARLRLAQWLQRLKYPQDAVLAPLMPAIWQLPLSERMGFEVPVARLLLDLARPEDALRLLSPEQWQYHQQLDRKFDVWLLRLRAYLALGDLEHTKRINEIVAWMALDAGTLAQRRYQALLERGR